MAGRLGMTGASVARGDKVVFGKAIGKPFQIAMAGPTKAAGRGKKSRTALQNEDFRRRFREQNRASDGPRTVPGINYLHGASRAMKRPARSFNFFDDAPETLYQRLRGGRVMKVDTTMSDRRAQQLAARYDTRGPLPKHLDRNQRMAAYEARYIASGGRKAEKWKRRADSAERGRNIGLAGATIAGAGILARKAPGIRRIPHHRLETAAVASGVFGGASELYGEHARSRRASYQNSPGGVAASALQRMRAYTPGGN